MTYEELEKNYSITNYAKGYLLGFIYHKHLFVFKTEHVSWKHARCSAGRGLQLRFAPTKDERFEMVWNGAEKLMTEQEFIELGEYSNKGHAFEKIICEMYGQDGRPNSVPYWEAGDVVIDGEHYQIKFEQGSVAEKSVAKAMEVLGL